MAIMPLPQFEADLKELKEERDREAYAKMRPPTSVVARFGVMKMVGEFSYGLNIKPGCGTKLIIRTQRGTEVGEMLTSTCPNAGCSKSVTRKQMLEYIENSGGKDYPFFAGGKVLRIATAEDLATQERLDEESRSLRVEAKALAAELGLPMKIIDVEQILGRERITYFFGSEDRVDFRELVSRLGGLRRTRVELRQIGARDEARVAADYERCGQHCCCKQFLKVLKPVSMKSAKTQKATLDPLKISGRCGRLMCCLRYEDETYEDLKKRLPRKRMRVMTAHGAGTVIDGQILTQLVLVRLDTGGDVAVPNEEIDREAVVPPPGEAPSGGAGVERGGRHGRTGRTREPADGRRGAGDRPEGRSERREGATRERSSGEAETRRHGDERDASGERRKDRERDRGERGQPAARRERPERDRDQRRRGAEDRPSDKDRSKERPQRENANNERRLEDERDPSPDVGGSGETGAGERSGTDAGTAGERRKRRGSRGGTRKRRRPEGEERRDGQADGESGAQAGEHDGGGDERAKPEEHQTEGERPGEPAGGA